MRLPDRYSTSPSPSWATRPGLQPRPVSFADTVMAIWRWWRGRRRPVPLREQLKTAKLIYALAEEVAEADDAGKSKR